MLNGVDVSGWNSPEITNGAQFVMIKASEGVNYKSDGLDAHFDKYVGSLEESVLRTHRYGFYHYARPEITGNTAKAEAESFLSFIGHHKGYCACALDWEGEAVKYGVNYALKWLQTVENYMGYKPLFYCNPSQIRSEKYRVIENAGYPLWVAHWGVTHPDTGIWKSWYIWQYTDTPYDRDYCPSDEIWKKLAPKYNFEISPSVIGWRITEQSENRIILERNA